MESPPEERPPLPPNGGRSLSVEQHSLVTDHLYQVYALARVTIPNDPDYDEKVGDGMLGLIDAAMKFDASQGCQFNTYAGWRIKGAIVDGFRKRHGGRRHNRKWLKMVPLPDEGKNLEWVDDQKWRDSIADPNDPIDTVVANRLYAEEAVKTFDRELIKPKDRRTVEAYARGECIDALAAEWNVTGQAISHRKVAIAKRLRKVLNDQDTYVRPL